MLQMKSLSVGELSTCCYIVYDDASEGCVVIDPGAEPERIRRACEGRRIEAILLTHGHFDHITGADEIRDASGAPLAVHEADADFLTTDKNAHKYFFREELVMRPAEIILHDGDVLPLGASEIKVMHTPGHTKGSVCFLVGNDLYTGDTLFDRSIGRTDLYGGNQGELEESLRKLCALEHDYHIYPGHGSVSTLYKQISYNPYLYGGNL